MHDGLRVVSDLYLPELGPAVHADTCTEPDVRVVLEAPLRNPVCEKTLEVSPGRCRFQAPDVGSYEVRDGREIMVRPFPRAPSQLVRLFTVGSAWAALLQQRGAMALHAGVVTASDGAVAFCGPPSAGKSSIVAWLTRRGHGLISDDLCRVEVSAEGRPQVWPSTPRLKLSEDALAHIGWSAQDLERARPVEKFYLPWTGPRPPGPVELHAIYLLKWGTPSVSRLTGINALRRFVAAATFRPQFLEPADELARHWAACEQIVRQVPVWELVRPRDWTVLDRVMNPVTERLIPAV
jgi:hypothetical protein